MKYEPMLCKTGTPKLMASIHSTNSHYLEEKLDGLRCLAYCGGTGHKLYNRQGVDITKRFPEVVLPKQQVVLDGELCCFDEHGYSDFQLIQTRMHRQLNIDIAAEQHPAVFVPFDCLEYNNLPLTDKPYTSRSNIAMNVAKDWGLTPPRMWQGTVLTEDWLEAECSKGMEGVIAKAVDSIYAPGLRSSHWLKFKGWRVGTYEVLGATYGVGKRESTFGALVLGINGKAIGNVGTGFDDTTLAELDQVFKTIKAAKCDPNLKYTFPGNIMWCKVKYQELTSNGTPRFPVFKELLV